MLLQELYDEVKSDIIITFQQMAKLKFREIKCVI